MCDPPVPNPSHSLPQALFSSAPCTAPCLRSCACAAPSYQEVGDSSFVATLPLGGLLRALRHRVAAILCVGDGRRPFPPPSTGLRRRTNIATCVGGMRARVEVGSRVLRVYGSTRGLPTPVTTDPPSRACPCPLLPPPVDRPPPTSPRPGRVLVVDYLPFNASRTLKKFFQDHTRIAVVLLALALAILSYAILDPIRIFFIKASATVSSPREAPRQVPSSPREATPPLCEACVWCSTAPPPPRQVAPPPFLSQ